LTIGFDLHFRITMANFVGIVVTKIPVIGIEFPVLQEKFPDILLRKSAEKLVRLARRLLVTSAFWDEIDIPCYLFRMFWRMSLCCCGECWARRDSNHANDRDWKSRENAG
jgi:hypothetical protein